MWVVYSPRKVCIVVVTCDPFMACRWDASCCQDASLLKLQMRQIRYSVSADTFQTLMIALIYSRLDYGNSCPSAYVQPAVCSDHCSALASPTF